MAAYANRSGAITVAATTQKLMSENSNRKGFFIQNPSTNTGQNIGAAESLFINFTSAAGIEDGASIELQPGESYSSNIDTVTAEQINIIATTVGHRYIAKELL